MHSMFALSPSLRATIPVALVSVPECLVVLQRQRWPTMMINMSAVKILAMVLCLQHLTAKAQCVSSDTADLETVLEWSR